MNVKKFVAASSREAWRNVRETLGPDAVILSNRTIKGGVEILAMANEEMSSLATPAPARRAMRPPAKLDEVHAPTMSAASFVAHEALRAKSESAPSAVAP